MKTNMKALLIDCIKQEVTEINIKGGLKGWYNALSTEFGKVSLVEVVYANLPKGDAILCDEEGMYSNIYGGIQLETTGIQLINNCLVIGCADKNGNTTDVKATAEEFSKYISFLTPIKK